MLNHAIIGCGVIGPVHKEALTAVEGSRLVAVCDLVEEQAKKLGEAAGVPWFTDRDKMIAAVPIDIIHVCVPSGLHHEIAVWAAQQGKHCFCEKPMDITLEAMDQITKAFKKSGTRYGGCFMNRFNPAAMLAKKAIVEGRLGRLTTASGQCLWWRTQEYYDSGAWRGTWELDGGGCLMNQAVHYVDLLQWLVGSPVKTIRAYTGLLAHQRIAVEDVAVAILRFDNGVLATLQGTTAAFPQPHAGVEVCGDQGNLTYEDRLTRWQFAEARPEDEEIRRTGGLPPTFEVASAAADGNPASLGFFVNMFVGAFREFTAAIRDNKPNACGPDEHRKAVEIILGLYDSARRGGEEVRLPLKKSAVPVPLFLPKEYKLVNPKRPPLPAAMIEFAKKQKAAKAKRK